MHSSILTENIELVMFRKMLFCMFKFCRISNYSNALVLLNIFVSLYKQGALIITRQKNKEENFR